MWFLPQFKKSVAGSFQRPSPAENKSFFLWTLAHGWSQEGVISQGSKVAGEGGDLQPTSSVHMSQGYGEQETDEPQAPALHLLSQAKTRGNQGLNIWMNTNQDFHFVCCRGCSSLRLCLSARSSDPSAKCVVLRRLLLSEQKDSGLERKNPSRFEQEKCMNVSFGSLAVVCNFSWWEGTEFPGVPFSISLQLRTLSRSRAV